MIYIPSKEEARKIRTMIESELTSYKHYYLWCDEIIGQCPNPPYWIIELSVTKFTKQAERIVGEFASSEPFEKEEFFSYEDLFIACLFIRYERREISWATFLEKAGGYSDGYGCKKECEYFYRLLNEFEDSEYSLKYEKMQVLDVKNIFRDDISIAQKLYNAFLPYFREYVKKHKGAG